MSLTEKISAQQFGDSFGLKQNDRFVVKKLFSDRQLTVAQWNSLCLDQGVYDEPNDAIKSFLKDKGK